MFSLLNTPSTPLNRFSFSPKSLNPQNPNFQKPQSSPSSNGTGSFSSLARHRAWSSSPPERATLARRPPLLTLASLARFGFFVIAIDTRQLDLLIGLKNGINYTVVEDLNGDY
ncbi:hypothetical protein Ddye_006233 [Dipteronia dyeriana]|uniref:Uncharacterized protein n=1 Tax=Dipteronia dyeriana TaxID=168575 RepID=A0AAD9XHN2_9ROSI|nr:hypothetical protein Ddye_006233 [Dipteronia dyeriana]